MFPKVRPRRLPFGLMKLPGTKCHLSRSLSFQEKTASFLAFVVQRQDEALSRRSHVGGGVVSKGFAEQSEDEGEDGKDFHV